ncbi:MAG: Ig-like domain-containing protein [bacterium]
MRQRLIFAVVALAGCASAAVPPGGPEDKVPPKLVKVSPDTNAVNFTDKAVQFQFDETINDRGTAAQELDNFFLVSPSDGLPRLSYHRSRIDIAPRHGFRPNTAYTVTVLPGLGDLRGNSMKTGATVVFSTGPTIPKGKIEGIAFDWASGSPVRAYIEALTPDSIRYLAQSDSGGKFTLGPLTDGTYLVRAIVDQNNNHALDRSEAFDTLRVTVPLPAPVQLLAALRDTLPAAMNVPTISDSLTSVTVTFDRLLDPMQSIASTAFRLIGSDSVEVPISAALSPLELRRVDSLRFKAEADSARRADSLAGKPVTPPPAAVVVAPTPGKAPPPPPPKPNLPLPFNTVTLRLQRPLKPSFEYRLSTTGPRALSGKSLSSERRFSTPKPPAPKPAAKDSVPGTTVPKAPTTAPSRPTTPPRSR